MCDPLRSNPSFPLQLSDPHIMDHPWIRSGASFKGTVNAAGAGAMAFSRRWRWIGARKGYQIPRNDPGVKIWTTEENMEFPGTLNNQFSMDLW